MSDENTDQTASNSDKGEPPQTERPQRPNPPSNAPLGEQLAALKQEKAAFDAKLVDKSIADLEKLIDEVETAKKGYTKPDYDVLVARQKALEREKDTLKKTLEAGLGDEIGEIKEIQDAFLKDIDAASEKVAETNELVIAAQAVAAEKTATMEHAKATLDQWKKPASSIDTRHKAASDLIRDIKKLRNGPNRGEAYWKLALGDRDHLAGQGFLHLLLTDPPELINPDKLVDKIKAAWVAFAAARKDAAAAMAHYATAQAHQKAAKADYDAKTKNIIKTIIDALAVREAPPAK